MVHRVEPKEMAQLCEHHFGFHGQVLVQQKNTPDVFYILYLLRKPTETFCEYATKWRSEASKVRPPGRRTDKQVLRTCSGSTILWKTDGYWESQILIHHQIRRKIEEGIKSGMVTNFEAFQVTNIALQSGGISEKEVGTVMVAQGPKSPLTYQTSPPTYHPSTPNYHYPAITYHTYNTQPIYYQSPHLPSKNIISLEPT